MNLVKWWGWWLLCGSGWWFYFMAPFSSWLGSSALNSALLTLRKRGVWPTIEAVKGCVWVLVRGCLGLVGCVFGGCWAVWRRGVFRACEGVFVVCRMGGKGLICCENVLGGAESAAICLGRSRVRGSMLVCGCRRAFCQPWRWQIVELPIVSRRHLDRYSLLFRSFFACSSFGPRSVFDRLTNNERETNERRTRT